MIFVRDDDVLLSSKDTDSLGRFKRVHELICSNPRFVHVAAILVEEIQTVPGAVEYIREENANGRLKLQLHGLRHVDYGAMDIKDVHVHLSHSIEWMFQWFRVIPTKWYTPWGSTQEHLHVAAKAAGLQLVDCSNRIKTCGENGALDLLRKHGCLDPFEDKELHIHWWSAQDRERLQMLVNYERQNTDKRRWW